MGLSQMIFSCIDHIPSGADPQLAIESAKQAIKRLLNRDTGDSKSMTAH
jgi:hypothetical protein